MNEKPLNKILLKELQGSPDSIVRNNFSIENIGCTKFSKPFFFRTFFKYADILFCNIIIVSGFGIKNKVVPANLLPGTTYPRTKNTSRAFIVLPYRNIYPMAFLSITN